MQPYNFHFHVSQILPLSEFDSHIFVDVLIIYFESFALSLHLYIDIIYLFS